MSLPDASGVCSRFSFLVLAGGRSSRMGRDKAALPFGSGTLLSHQMGKARALRIGDILLSGPGGVPDRVPGMGPLAGLHAGLSAAAHPYCIVLPVDAPLVPAEELLRLARLHLEGGAAVTLAAHGGKTEPLIGVYDSSLSPLIAACLQRGETKVRSFLCSVPVRTADSSLSEKFWINVNTPADLARISEL
ncbi:MAG: molybdenum cofactor guanylyltransferase [Clostridia bacterium]|nr:molybdenum cofactor guanylyltransferase [Clostridia bacterium]